MRNRIAARALAALALTIAAAGCDATDLVNTIGDVDNTDFVASEAFDFQVGLNGQTTFSLAGVNGTMEVSVDPQATAVRVSGVRKVGSSSTADARAHLPLLTVEVDESPGTISVRTEQPNETRGRNYVVDYVVTVPPGLRAAVANVNGNIRLNGSFPEVDVGGVNGNIDVVGAAGSVSAGLVNGNITADVTLPTPAAATLGTVNGNLTLTVQRSVDADLSASWVNGGFSAESIQLDLLETTQTSVRARLGTGAGQISMGATNGRILLRGRG